MDGSVSEKPFADVGTLPWTEKLTFYSKQFVLNSVFAQNPDQTTATLWNKSHLCSLFPVALW